MTTPKTNDLADRRSSAIAAKAEILNAYRAKMDEAEPGRKARLEERMAIAAAREERHRERDLLKAEAQRLQQAEDRRVAEEASYLDAANVAARAKIEAEQKSDNMIARVVKDEAERKADRDKRYANRQARQR